MNYHDDRTLKPPDKYYVTRILQMTPVDLSESGGFQMVCRNYMFVSYAAAFSSHKNVP